MTNRIITVLIVDDDDAARNILEKFLGQKSEVKIIDSVNNAASAMAVVESNEPDLIFLDINMPHEDGLFFARKLKERKSDCLIVFTTAYRNYALHAIDLTPVDYLLKPFGFNEIEVALTKVNEALDEVIPENFNIEWGSNDLPKLKFKVKKGYIFIDPKEILYIHANGYNSELMLVDGNCEIIGDLISDLSNKITTKGFVNINRSVIVNVRYIDKIDRKERKCIIKYDDNECNFQVSRSKISIIEQINSIKLG